MNLLWNFFHLQLISTRSLNLNLLCLLSIHHQFWIHNSEWLITKIIGSAPIVLIHVLLHLLSCFLWLRSVNFMPWCLYAGDLWYSIIAFWFFFENSFEIEMPCCLNYFTGCLVFFHIFFMNYTLDWSLYLILIIFLFFPKLFFIF